MSSNPQSFVVTPGPGPSRGLAAGRTDRYRERHAVFEETSHHTAIGLDYPPPVARRLRHGRDLGEPFDFITLFEYAPQHAPMFDQMLERLRATHEWTFIDREVDIRLERIHDEIENN